MRQGQPNSQSTSYRLLGAIALFLGYLEYQRWISVNWAIVENQTQMFMTHAAHKAYVITNYGA